MKRHSAFFADHRSRSFSSVRATIPSATTSASKEDIQQLFEVMQIHQQMRQVMDAMMKQAERHD